MTSETSTPESSPKLGNRELPTADPPSPAPAAPAELPNVDALDQREHSGGKVDYKKNRSKIRKARKRAIDKVLSKVSSKLTDGRLRDSIEKRFVSNADPTHVEHFDASNFSAASTGFVGLGGKFKNGKKSLKLENIGKDPRTKGFRIVKYDEVYAFSSLPMCPLLTQVDRNPFPSLTARIV